VGWGRGGWEVMETGGIGSASDAGGTVVEVVRAGWVGQASGAGGAEVETVGAGWVGGEILTVVVSTT